ncbi:hypothetical protein CHU98_g12269 [Xylaria longipes]|nr:hypothetical protein CHU98_g12269 [Xylaria longipes]
MRLAGWLHVAHGRQMEWMKVGLDARMGQNRTGQEDNDDGHDGSPWRSAKAQDAQHVWMDICEDVYTCECVLARAMGEGGSWIMQSKVGESGAYAASGKAARYNWTE